MTFTPSKPSLGESFYNKLHLMCHHIPSGGEVLMSKYDTYKWILKYINMVCNAAKEKVPGGLVCISGLASECVMVVWSHR